MNVLLRFGSILNTLCVLACFVLSFLVLFAALFILFSRPFLDRPGVRQVSEGSGEQGKMEKTGCKIICGAPTTLAVKGLMMMMMMIFCSVNSFLTRSRSAIFLTKCHTIRYQVTSESVTALVLSSISLFCYIRFLVIHSLFSSFVPHLCHIFFHPLSRRLSKTLNKIKNS